MNETTDFSLFPGSHQLADKARRVPRIAWPFIVLAAAQTVLFVGLGYLDFRNIAIWVIPTLLPVAVIIGRRDAWESARVIMIGAILWGSVGALVQVLGLGQQRFAADPGADTVVDFILRVAVRLATLIAIAAPALIMLGLRTRRKTDTSWPKALVTLAVVVTAALCVYDYRQALDWQQIQNNFGYYVDISLRDRLDAIAQGLDPLRLLALGALAWSTISAFRANEAPRRFWLAVCAGSTLLFASELYSTLETQIPVSVIWNATYQVQAVATLTGLVLLLIGFGLGLPDSDEDAPGAVLPDAVAPGA